MAITAALVKELRERTGAGMMECKKTLVETNGDIEAAVELMRKTGLAKADKKAGRIAAEGLVAVATDGNRGVIVEVNCETDFVSKGDDFKAFVQSVADVALAANPADLDALMAANLGGGTVEDTRKEMIAKIGENMAVRRFVAMTADTALGVYLHGARIGVVVALSGGNEDLARDVAMHVAASNPMCIDESGIPAEAIAKEREIVTAQAADSGKPEAIIEKMVDGRMKKFVNEVTLVGQPFVKDPDTTVGKLLAASGATVTAYVRYEVGEGIEKKQEDFAAEVMAQVKGS
ncbi:MAG: elongation factor Ts [Gammaproteobacteria bacterium]|nr:elongation factor Ts [Gammaproteobacteria bacterium]MCP5135311.1 elongation factor Ts [Gammaproteobacteria bacterium]